MRLYMEKTKQNTKNTENKKLCKKMSKTKEKGKITKRTILIEYDQNCAGQLYNFIKNW